MTTTEEMTVTAEMARHWLARNTLNRRLSAIRVRQLADAMIRGEWRISTDAVGFEGPIEHGRLVNGQHRLSALVLADDEQPGITIPLAVAVDLPPDSTMLIDTGKSRSLEDTLFFLGEEESRPKLLSAAVLLAWHVEHSTYVSRQPTPTRRQAIDFLKNNPDLRDAVPIGATMARGAHVPASGLMTAVWLIGRGDNVDQLDRFAGEVAYGENIGQDDMTYRLRELFNSWGYHRIVDRSRPWKTCAMTVVAWNCMISGRPIKLSRKVLTEIPTAL